MKQLLLFIICTALLTACTTYKKCIEKFGEVQNDTVTLHVPIAVTLPRDSAVARLKTDFTPINMQVTQGRATVHINRTPTTTTVKAVCDTVTVTKIVPVQVPIEKHIFKDDPDKVPRWYRTGFWILILIVLIAVIEFSFYRSYNQSR